MSEIPSSDPRISTTIWLEPADVRRALTFAWKICKDDNQVETDFGRSDLPRQLVDRVADTAEGKMAELAFARFVEQHGHFSIELDFDIYLSKLAIDYGQDVDEVIENGIHRPCRSRIDVKATRAYSKWLLVEQHKFWADAYIIAKVDLPHDIESSVNGLKQLADSRVKAEIAGFAYHFDLIDPATKEPWFLFRKGDRLFDPKILDTIKPEDRTNAKSLSECLHGLKKNSSVRYLGEALKAQENFGIPMSELRKSDDDWKSLFAWIRNSALTQ